MMLWICKVLWVLANSLVNGQNKVSNDVTFNRIDCPNTQAKKINFEIDCVCSSEVPSAWANPSQNLLCSSSHLHLSSHLSFVETESISLERTPLTAQANPPQKLLRSSPLILCLSHLHSGMKFWDRINFARANSFDRLSEPGVNYKHLRKLLPIFSQDALLNPNLITALEARPWAYI